MTQSISKYKGPVEISVVVTPWNSEYMVVNHINPKPEDLNGKFGHLMKQLEINGGKHVFSINKNKINIHDVFPNWLKNYSNLEIKTDSIPGIFEIENSTVKELFSEDYLTKRSTILRNHFQNLSTEMKGIKVEDMSYYKDMVKHNLYQIIFNQLIINSAPKQIMFEKNYVPIELFFDKKGFIISNADMYSYQSGKIALFKITDIDKNLNESCGIFSHYSIFTQFPVNGYAKYLSPGERMVGNLDKLREEKRLFNIEDSLMIIQPENSNDSLYNAIRE
jgi:hypothetical protein